MSFYRKASLEKISTDNSGGGLCLCSAECGRFIKHSVQDSGMKGDWPRYHHPLRLQDQRENMLTGNGLLPQNAPVNWLMS